MLPVEQNKALATTPVEALLALPFLQPDQVEDSLHAYQLSKRGNSLRVMAEAVRWGKRHARINTISPGIIMTPLAKDELSGPRGAGYRRMIDRSVAGRAGTPDEVGSVGALLMGPDGAFITGADFLMDGAAVGDHPDLLAIKLDVNRPDDARAAVETAVGKLGRVDILVNNAGNFYAGFFEELSPEQVRNQIETLLFGPMNVTRAALPVMRNQRSGLLLTISSTAGIAGGMFCTAYAAAKFGIEGWMESLAPEVAPFGIRTMLVEPGFFRTELLTPESTTYAQPSISDYVERTRETVAAWSSMDGKQGGEPAKLADALVRLAGLDERPLRFAAGADAVQTFEAKAKTLLAQANAHRDLSSSLCYDET